jgi:DNA-binding NarL/FixJ family response regulator
MEDGMIHTSRPTLSDNRRTLERFSMRIPSKVSPIMPEQPEQTLPTANISATGVFFETATTYPVGTTVTLNISLDFGGARSGQPQPRFRVEGRVVRAEGNGMAIAFDPLKVTSIRLNPARKPGKSGPSMIGIVGEDPLLNDLLAARLSQETGVSCSHSPSLAKILERARPDLTLIDCTGVDMQVLLREAGGENSPFMATSVALFNVPDDQSVELEALHSGVRGIFYRNASFKLMTRGVNAMLDNELWFSREAMSAFLLGRQNRPAELAAVEGEQGELSQREKEILLMLAAGATNKDIAEKLFLSLNTIKSHIYNIYKKIDVPNRLQASLWAARHLGGPQNP